MLGSDNRGAQQAVGILCTVLEIRDVITQGSISQQLIEVRTAVFVRPFHRQRAEQGSHSTTATGQTWSRPGAGAPIAPPCFQGLQVLILVVISFYKIHSGSK